jgi:AraC family transcriptional regulator
MTRLPHLRAGRHGRVGVFNLGEAIAEHAHPQAHALMKISGPDGAFNVAGEDYPLDGESLLAINPWQLHSGPRRQSPAGTRMLVLYLNPTSWGATGRLPLRQKVFGQVHHPMDAALKASARRLHQLMAIGSAGADDVDDLLLQVRAAHGIDHDDRSAPRMDYRVRRAIDRMLANPVAARDLSRCAGIAGLSRSHFFRMFRESTGISPRLFSNALRLEAAMDRLRDTGMPIRRVADGLGFSAPSHFTRFLIHHTGSSPRAVRQGLAGVDS